MTAESTLIIMFCVVTAVAVTVRWLRVPYTVALVLTGLLLGTLHLIEPPHLTKELLFAIFLPGLIFEAAYHLEFDDFKRNGVAIIALAIPGVVVAIVVTALLATTIIGALHLDRGFTWEYGLLFGALVAATDPVAVTALFRQLNAPRRLSVLVEGESLLNDGTTIVFLSLILAYVTGASPSGGSLLRDFVMITGGGALVGAVVGVLASQITKRVDDPMIEITITTIAAYGSFVLGEQLGFSGVISTVVAGMLCGNYGRRVGMMPATRVAVATFWEFNAFALNSVVFLLIGFAVSLGGLVRSWREIVVAYVAVLLARALTVVAVTGALRHTRERISGAWAVVLTWGGLRGALSMVLALALPLAMPHRDILVTMTVGVVLLSLLVQGFTMSPLVRRLGVTGADDALLAYDFTRAETQVVRIAMAELDRMRDREPVPHAVLQHVRERYEVRRSRAEARAESLAIPPRAVLRDETVRTVRRLLMAERNCLASGLQDGTVRREVYDVLSADVDMRLVLLEAGEFADPAELAFTRRAMAGVRREETTAAPEEGAAEKTAAEGAAEKTAAVAAAVTDAAAPGAAPATGPGAPAGTTAEPEPAAPATPATEEHPPG